MQPVWEQLAAGVPRVLLAHAVTALGPLCVGTALFFACAWALRLPEVGLLLPPGCADKGDLPDFQRAPTDCRSAGRGNRVEMFRLRTRKIPFFSVLLCAQAANPVSFGRDDTDSQAEFLADPDGVARADWMIVDEQLEGLFSRLVELDDGADREVANARDGHAALGQPDDHRHAQPEDARQGGVHGGHDGRRRARGFVPPSLRDDRGRGRDGGASSCTSGATASACATRASVSGWSIRCLSARGRGRRFPF